jgi:uncharacterized protein (TIGR02231 family)
MFRFCLPALLLLAPFAAQAAEIPATSEAAAVTVFPSGAEVTRTVSISLEAGSHVAVLRDLPAGIEENSVRVEGQLNAAVEIMSVDTKQIFVKQPGQQDAADESERKRLEQEIDKLRDAKAGLDGIIEGATAVKTLAQNLATLPLAGQHAGPAQPQPAPDWSTVFDLIGPRFNDAQQKLVAARAKQRDLDATIDELQQRLRRQPVEQTERTELRIFVEAAAPAEGQLRIRYRVRNASWQPVYDARLATETKDGKPQLSLTRRASISQSSGEDWNDIELQLSTARPGERTSTPVLRPVQVQFAMPLGAAGGAPRGMPAAAPAPSEELALSKSAADRLEKPKMRREAVETGAAVERSTYQTVFKLPAKVTVKNGTGAKKVLIASETLAPAIKLNSVPKDVPAAYINAHFTYQGAAPILPGAVSLYRDNVFAGMTRFPLVAAGQEHDLSFGADDSIKINRISLKRQRGESGLITTSNTDVQDYRITVKNLHAAPVQITVLDQIPYSEDEKITVQLLPATTQPVVSNYEDKRGILAWNLELKPGEEKVITLSYQMTWPVKQEIVTVPR